MTRLQVGEGEGRSVKRTTSNYLLLWIVALLAANHSHVLHSVMRKPNEGEPQ